MSHMTTDNWVTLLFFLLLSILALFIFFRYRNLVRGTRLRVSWRFQLLHILGAIFVPFIELIILWACFDEAYETLSPADLKSIM
jgi:hypothetical protein